MPLALAGDQRRQIELMDKLASHLQRDGARVQVLTMPVDVQPEKALRSDERSGSAGAQMKNFVLQVSLPAHSGTTSSAASATALPPGARS